MYSPICHDCSERHAFRVRRKWWERVLWQRAYSCAHCQSRLRTPRLGWLLLQRTSSAAQLVIRCAVSSRKGEANTLQRRVPQPSLASPSHRFFDSM